jgi:hypothetical protein
MELVALTPTLEVSAVAEQALAPMTTAISRHSRRSGDTAEWLGRIELRLERGFIAVSDAMVA